MALPKWPKCLETPSSTRLVCVYICTTSTVVARGIPSCLSASRSVVLLPLLFFARLEGAYGGVGSGGIDAIGKRVGQVRSVACTVWLSVITSFFRYLFVTIEFVSGER